jgi:sugar/nucleoside kinase (ribokinase family)
MTYDFVGVGGLAVDLVLRVDRLPINDDKTPATLAGKLPGGFIANATCAAARLGLKAGYAGWIGDDADGRLLHQDFQEWKVDPAGLVCFEDEPTPFTVVIVDRQGRRNILLPDSPLYSTPLTFEQVTLARQARVVYTFPRDARWFGQLRRATLESDGLLALDVENAVPMSGSQLLDVIQLADIVFVTENSLKSLGLPPLRKLASDQEWVIMTAGARGSYGVARGMRKPVFQPALPVEAVDTTGAGDCFHAALIAAKLDGADLPEALAFASAAAAIKVQHEGARGGLPTRAEVERMLSLRRA